MGVVFGVYFRRRLSFGMSKNKIVMKRLKIYFMSRSVLKKNLSQIFDRKIGLSLGDIE